MNRSTLSHFGWVIIVVIIIIILIGAFAPFVQLIRANLNYTIDEFKRHESDALDDMGGVGEDTDPDVITYYTQEDIDASGGRLKFIGLTHPLYVVAAFNEDYSEVVITKNGDDSDGKAGPLDWNGWVSESTYYPRLVNATVKKGVTSLNSTFVGCSSIVTVTLPEGLTEINESSFHGCCKLENVNLPNSVTTIGRCAFFSCYKLKNITIPDTVSSIGRTAFYECRSFTNITVPQNVTILDGSVFGYCINLTTITLHKNITDIGYHVFEQCTNLENIYYDGTIDQWRYGITFNAEWNEDTPYFAINCTDNILDKDNNIYS